MSGGTLKVDPVVLQGAATSFGQAADGLGTLQAAASLGDAAAAVPSLQIAVASLAAQSDVAAETAALADGAREFGDSLGTAARWYEGRDQAAADAIDKIEMIPAVIRDVTAFAANLDASAAIRRVGT
jgi:excreted virulence factor EspC (type VII ESX diderm)